MVVDAKLNWVELSWFLSHIQVSSTNKDHILLLRAEHTDITLAQAVCTLWVTMTVRCVYRHNRMQSGKKEKN